MKMSSQEAQNIKDLALQSFTAVGFASVRDRESTLPKYEAWLAQGFGASMNYLTRHLEQKKNPELLLAGAKSWIALSTHYDTAEPLSTEISDQLKNRKQGWVARYARGPDYHDVIRAKHNILIGALSSLYPNGKFRGFVDSGPVLERDVARSAGLGWVGKNSCLIHPKTGSFFFLSEILTTLELPPDRPIADHCGTCTRCLDACPTGALVGPHVLDARKCISFWTIESKQAPPQELSQNFQNNLFGCDICQDVCPWNQKARRSEPLPQPQNLNTAPWDLSSLSTSNLEEVANRIKGTALERAGATRLQENAKQLMLHQQN